MVQSVVDTSRGGRVDEGNQNMHGRTYKNIQEQGDLDWREKKCFSWTIAALIGMEMDTTGFK